MPKKISQEIIDQMIEFYEQGLSSEVIGPMIGSKPQTVTRYLKEHGIQIRGPKKKLTQDDKKEMSLLYEEGLSCPKIAAKFNVTEALVLRYVRQQGIKIRNASECHRKYAINENFFDVIDTEEKAYFLGFLYADGCNNIVNNTLCIDLSVVDKDILYKLSKLIYLENPEDRIKFYDRTEEGKYFFSVLNIHSKHICQQLEKIGCPPAKSFKIVYPEWMPEHLHKHFIRGYFDGDGGMQISYKINVPSAFRMTSTKKFLEGAQTIIDKYLCIHTNISPSVKNSDKDTFDLGNSGNRNTLIFTDWMYEGSKIYLHRKYALWRDLKAKMHYLDNLIEEGNQGYSKANLTKTSHINTELVFDKIIKINDQPITAEFLKNISAKSKEELVPLILKEFRTLGWRYPDNLSMIKSEYQKLIDCKIDINQNTLNNNDSLATYICKFFCHSFYQATKFKKKNMIELFEDDETLIKVIRNRIGLDWKECFNLNPKMIIQGMRSMGLVNLTGNFKPRIAKFVNLKYSQPGDVIFDYSAGFGGRMLGAASANRKYIGVDPLTATELKKMRDFLRLENCTLIDDISENYKGEENSVDLAWSSPPFYNQEFYSPDARQAYNRGEKYFYEVYWKKTLENVKFMLKPGKYFGLHIKNYPNMLDMAIQTFGPVVDLVNLETKRSHLKNSENLEQSKLETIKIFINNK